MYFGLYGFKMKCVDLRLTIFMNGNHQIKASLHEDCFLTTSSHLPFQNKGQIPCQKQKTLLVLVC